MILTCRATNELIFSPRNEFWPHSKIKTLWFFFTEVKQLSGPCICGIQISEHNIDIEQRRSEWTIESKYESIWSNDQKNWNEWFDSLVWGKWQSFSTKNRDGLIEGIESERWIDLIKWLENRNEKFDRLVWWKKIEYFQQWTILHFFVINSLKLHRVTHILWKCLETI